MIQRMITIHAVRTAIFTLLLIGLPAQFANATSPDSTLTPTAKAKEYHATVQIKVLRKRSSLGPTSVDSNEQEKQRVLDNRDFDEVVAKMRDYNAIRRIAKRLTEQEKKLVLANYAADAPSVKSLSLEEIMLKCRTITPEPSAFLVRVEYANPDKATALKLTNLFIEEWNNDVEREAAEATDPLVERLKIQCDQIEQEISELTQRRIKLPKQVSSDFPIRAKELSNLAEAKESARRDMEKARAQIKLIAAAKTAGAPIVTLSGIADDAQVTNMNAELAKARIQLNSAKQLHETDHPEITAAQIRLDATNKELNEAIAAAEAKLESKLKVSEAAYHSDQAQFEAKESELTTQRVALVRHESLDKEIKNKEELLSRMRRTYETEKNKRTGRNIPRIRIVDAPAIREDAKASAKAAGY